MKINIRSKYNIGGRKTEIKVMSIAHILRIWYQLVNGVSLISLQFRIYTSPSSYAWFLWNPDVGMYSLKLKIRKTFSGQFHCSGVCDGFLILGVTFFTLKRLYRNFDETFITGCTGSLTTSSATSDENLITMKILPGQSSADILWVIKKVVHVFPCF